MRLTLEDDTGKVYVLLCGNFKDDTPFGMRPHITQPPEEVEEFMRHQPVGKISHTEVSILMRYYAFGIGDTPDEAFEMAKVALTLEARKKFE